MLESPLCMPSRYNMQFSCLFLRRKKPYHIQCKCERLAMQYTRTKYLGYFICSKDYQNFLLTPKAIHAQFIKIKLLSWCYCQNNDISIHCTYWYPPNEEIIIWVSASLCVQGVVLFLSNYIGGDDMVVSVNANCHCSQIAKLGLLSAILRKADQFPGTALDGSVASLLDVRKSTTPHLH